MAGLKEGARKVQVNTPHELLRCSVLGQVPSVQPAPPSLAMGASLLVADVHVHLTRSSRFECLALGLGQGSSRGPSCPLRVQLSGGIFDYPTWGGGGAAGIGGGGARDADNTHNAHKSPTPSQELSVAKTSVVLLLRNRA